MVDLRRLQRERQARQVGRRVLANLQHLVRYGALEGEHVFRVHTTVADLVLGVIQNARVLRERLAYRGELRAVGDVLRDQIFLMRRCGFDSFALRPDRLGFAPTGGSALKITRSTYVGHSREYLVEAPWGEVLVVRPAHEAPVPVGTPIALAIDPGAAIVLA
jgi:hypothetical protein